MERSQSATNSQTSHLGLSTCRTTRLAPPSQFSPNLEQPWTTLNNLNNQMLSERSASCEEARRAGIQGEAAQSRTLHLVSSWRNFLQQHTKSFAFTILLRKPTKIFIGNVPVNCTSEDLRSVFETTGLDIHECDKVILWSLKIQSLSSRFCLYVIQYSGGRKRLWLCTRFLKPRPQGDL